MPTAPSKMVNEKAFPGKALDKGDEAAMSLLRLLLGQAPSVAPSRPDTMQLLMQRPQHHCGLDAVPEPQRPEHT